MSLLFKKRPKTGRFSYYNINQKDVFTAYSFADHMHTEAEWLANNCTSVDDFITNFDVSESEWKEKVDSSPDTCVALNDDGNYLVSEDELSLHSIARACHHYAKEKNLENEILIYLETFDGDPIILYKNGVALASPESSEDEIHSHSFAEIFKKAKRDEKYIHHVFLFTFIHLFTHPFY